jgi:hypothetical protein
MVLGVALVNLVHRAILSSMGHFYRASVSQVLLSGMLEFVTLLATAALIVMVVQEDSIPGLRQDWLVRPIRRRDLLLGKILFIALLAQGPIFLFEVGQCLAAGFPLGRSLAAPLSRSVWMFLAMDLPVLAFATLTRSLGQAVAASVAVVVGFAIFMVAALFYRKFAFGTGWINDSARVVWGLAGVAIVLALQYCRRKTTRARWAFGAATLVSLAVQFAPWRLAFATVDRPSLRPAAASNIQITFEPAFGRLHRVTDNSATGHGGRGTLEDKVVLGMPVRISGLAESQTLSTYATTARLIEPGGTKIDLRLAASPTIYPSYELVRVPGDIYNRPEDQSVGIEIDYSFTLRQANLLSVPASGGSQWKAGLGTCATRPSAGGTQLEVGCLAPGNIPCISLSVDYPGTVQTFAPGDECESEYTPFFGRVNGDSISRFARELYVIGTELEDARVVFAVYQSTSFTRQVVIPNIRLSDWRPE